MSLKLKLEAARTAKHLGHDLRPWQHDILNFLIVTECRICGATVRIRHGEIRGDAVTTSCSEPGMEHLVPREESVPSKWRTSMKRFPKAALVTANVLMLIALACSNEKVIGPAEAALNNVLALISPKDDNVLTVDEDELLYVPPPEASDFLSADSANALHIGNDGLLYAAVLTGGDGGEGQRGPEGPAGPEGPQGAEGPQGPPGTSVQIKGSVENAGNLPSGAQPGDGWLVQGDLWVWSGDGWKNVGRIQGPPGDRGPEGPQGQRGPEGPSGAKGERGAKGEKGDAGPEGPAGPKGEQGIQGEEGPIGPPGSPGPGGGGVRILSADGEMGPSQVVEAVFEGLGYQDVFMFQCYWEDESPWIVMPCDADTGPEYAGPLTIRAYPDPAWGATGGIAGQVRIVVITKQ